MLPKIIASVVVRAADHGTSHGGLYLVDLETDKYDCVLDWSPNIDYKGRGAERGLRGLANYDGNIVAAASSSILIIDKQFNVIETIHNEYLHYCHEICISNDVLYITSTGFDAIIKYDLKNKKFLESHIVKAHGIRTFDPNIHNESIKAVDSLHLNSINSYNGDIYFSGTNSGGLFKLHNNHKVKFANIPANTHNSQPMDQYVICNNTQSSKIELRNENNIIRAVNIKNVPKHKMYNSHLNDKIAKQPFARGLLRYKDILIGGSSPAMISVYMWDSFSNIKNIIMANDIRYAIHGIEIYA